jgi:hypothetical protein
MLRMGWEDNRCGPVTECGRATKSRRLSCLRRSHSQACKIARDVSAVVPEGQTGLARPRFKPPAVRTGDLGALALAWLLAIGTGCLASPLDVEDLGFPDGGLTLGSQPPRTILPGRPTSCTGCGCRRPGTRRTSAPSRRSSGGWRRIGPAGPVFRSFDVRGKLTENRLDPGDVARILRRGYLAAGIVGDFAGHSLRRGFISNATKKVTA